MHYFSLQQSHTENDIQATYFPCKMLMKNICQTKLVMDKSNQEPYWTSSEETKLC